MSIEIDYDKPSPKPDHDAKRTVAFVRLFTVLLAACAALPDDAPVVEQLDTETGNTIARLGRPIELYRETFTQDATSRFAFIGPFETNQMGKRDSFYGWPCRSNRCRTPFPASK
jgi:hypothetical protein